MTRKSIIAAAIVIVLGIAGMLYRGFARSNSDGSGGAEANSSASLVQFEPDRPGSLRVSEPGVRALGIQTIEVKPAPPPEPLRLPGSLLLDSNLLVRIHARFPGELVSLGTVQTEGKSAEQRTLQYGDKVIKGQILAVVWSKDVGEKKSELVDALSKQDIDKALLSKLEQVQKGVVPERMIHEARRNYEGDLIAVNKAERTLRSWRLTEQEIEDIHQEAGRIQKRETTDPQGDRTWAQTEVRAPISGTIIEKNFNVGDILDPAQDLFKVADLSRIQVLANAYEEDLPLLRGLRPDQRKWRIDIKADPNDIPVAGAFDIIGNIIDPAQHAGAVMGSLDNPDGRLSIGEFITATVDLPADPTLVAVPATALVEDGNSAMVFVETKAHEHEFDCRKIAVVRRGRERIYVRAEPNAAEQAAGAQPLAAGEHVVDSGALELAAELKMLRAAAKQH